MSRTFAGHPVIAVSDGDLRNLGRFRHRHGARSSIPPTNRFIPGRRFWSRSRVRFLDGRTPRSRFPRTSSGRARDPLLAWGDCVHFPAIQIAFPQFAVTYDLDAEAARRSRLRILGLAADQGFVVAGAHVAATGLGRIERAGEGFAFKPV